MESSETSDGDGSGPGKDGSEPQSNLPPVRKAKPEPPGGEGEETGGSDGDDGEGSGGHGYGSRHSRSGEGGDWYGESIFVAPVGANGAGPESRQNTILTPMIMTQLFANRTECEPMARRAVGPTMRASSRLMA